MEAAAQQGRQPDRVYARVCGGLTRIGVSFLAKVFVCHVIARRVAHIR
jgi:hypothetical protein